MWGCFSFHGVGDFYQSNGIFKKEGYKAIVEENAIPSGQWLIGDHFHLQQDNELKHTSKVCRAFRQQKEVLRRNFGENGLASTIP